MKASLSILTEERLQHLTVTPATVISMLFLVLMSLTACREHPGKNNSRGDEKNARVSCTLSTFTLENNEGFGYEILQGNRIVIHQNYIPALEGNQVFRTREDALKVGNEVLKKVEQNQVPALTGEEVRQLLEFR